MKRVTFASMLAALLVLTTGLGAAIAAPYNNPHAEYFTLECDDGETYEVLVTNGQPGHIIGTNSKIIPSQFTWEVVVTFLPDENDETPEPFVYSETGGVGQGQKKGHQDRLLTCEVDIGDLSEDEIEEILAEFEIDPETVDSVDVTFTVQGFKTPARR